MDAVSAPEDSIPATTVTTARGPATSATAEVVASTAAGSDYSAVSARTCESASTLTLTACPDSAADAWWSCYSYDL